MGMTLEKRRFELGDHDDEVDSVSKLKRMKFTDNYGGQRGLREDDISNQGIASGSCSATQMATDRQFYTDANIRVRNSPEAFNDRNREAKGMSGVDGKSGVGGREGTGGSMDMNREGRMEVDRNENMDGDRDQRLDLDRDIRMNRDQGGNVDMNTSGRKYPGTEERIQLHIIRPAPRLNSLSTFFKMNSPSNNLSNTDRSRTDSPSDVSRVRQPNLERTTSGFERPSSGFERPSSGFERPSTGFERPSSGFERPSSGFERPSSGFEQPSSGFDRPSSGFERPSSRSELTSTDREHPSPRSVFPSSGVERPCSPASSCDSLEAHLLDIGDLDRCNGPPPLNDKVVMKEKSGVEGAVDKSIVPQEGKEALESKQGPRLNVNVSNDKPTTLSAQFIEKLREKKERNNRAKGMLSIHFISFSIICIVNPPPPLFHKKFYLYILLSF